MENRPANPAIATTAPAAMTAHTRLESCNERGSAAAFAAAADGEVTRNRPGRSKRRPGAAGDPSERASCSTQDAVLK